MIFKAKDGPILTSGRLLHFGESATAVLLGAILGVVTGNDPYQGAAVAFSIVIVIAVVWEWMTPILAPKFRWRHPWGDLVDLVAFVLGGLIPIVILLWSH